MKEIGLVDGFRAAAAGAISGPDNRDHRAVQELVMAVQYLNKPEFSESRDGARFAIAYDDSSRRPIVKVVDETTSAVLYQIPPKEVIRMAAELRKRKAPRPDQQEL